MDFKIKQLNENDVEIMKLFHNWKINEKEMYLYTCRPLKPLDTFEEYLVTMSSVFESGNRTYYLENSEREVLGKITLFDINPRNKSAEFGYYFPNQNRGQGYGSILIKMFIETVFSDTTLSLNKLYATTSSLNNCSTKVLEKSHFKLDGIMREHYWIRGEVYDQLCYSLLRSEWCRDKSKKNGAS